jgi:hypothetical protein
MTNIQPIQTTQALRDTYTRYLRSLNIMNDENMNALYRHALDREEILKGPFIEGTLPFETGGTLNDLIAEGLLSQDFARLNTNELPLTRPIYLHQAQAIRKIISEQRNIIVATGTGSGKTESFLLPLLQMLFAVSPTERAQPGVRALLLYPMNALANDQLKRLRQLLANTPDITFGRYTGETPKSERDARDTYIRENGTEPLPNERISRESMRSRPPHILLTNYAMLEYLLLRPEDNMFFDGVYANRWNYLVLDEIHTYDGAKGVEIGMLIRRLKQRIRVKPGQLRCVGTSATIGSESELSKVAKFASQLFDEPFVWDDVHKDIVRGKRAILSGACWGHGTFAMYDLLHQGLMIAQSDNVTQKLSQFASIMQALRVHMPASVLIDWSTVTVESYEAFLYQVLVGDQRTHDAQQTLLAQAQSINDFAKIVNLAQDDVVVKYVELLLHAKRTPTEKPLLPSRYHLFAKSLEGMFICLNRNAHPLQNYEVSLHRFVTCPTCQKHAYELARCSRCGTPHLTGVLKDNRIQQPEYNDLNTTIPFALHLDDTPFAQLDDVIAEKGNNVEILHYALCTSCGLVRGQDGEPCRCGSADAVFISARQKPQAQANNTSETNTMNNCVMCGATSPRGSVIQTFDTGQDAPVSMLTSALYQQIPGRSTMHDTIGGGRRLIIFSDSRQDAAFFAPYLERNYAQNLQRRIILEQLNNCNQAYPNQVRIEGLKSYVRPAAERVFLFDEKHEPLIRDHLVLTWLMREVVGATRDETTLESQGLLHIRVLRPAHFAAPTCLTQFGLTTDESWLVVQYLLDTIRRQRTVTYPNGVEPNAVELQPGKSTTQLIRKIQPKDDIISWMPGAGHNQRSKFLIRIIKHLQPQLDIAACKRISLEVLDALWDELTKPSSTMKSIWHVTSKPQTGDLYQIKYEYIEFTPYTQPSGFICDSCRQRSFINIRGICTNTRCNGKLIVYAPALSDWTIAQQNYLAFAQVGMIVKEHSGNLAATQARAIQLAFTEGKVNTLSCTTTFELGVDVGELQTVMMRNMPPTSANYIQRAGRAGRRDGAAALILTFAQRRPHDLNYFVDPTQMISGIIPAPRFQSDNEKIVRRHLHAVILAAFLREWNDRHQKLLKKSGDFFERKDNEINPHVRGLIEFVERRPKELQSALYEVIDANLHEIFDIANWGWVGTFDESQSDCYLNSLYLAETQLNKDFDELKELRAITLNEIHAGSSKAHTLLSIDKILDTLRKRELFGVLPNFSLMPKYGFPTDVVPLKTDHIAHEAAKFVSLERDLRIAIGEYAPGSQVVAAGVVWESGGVVIPSGRGLIKGSYYRCPDCEFMTRSLGPGQINHCQNCAKPVTLLRLVKQYIIPEFGFIAHVDKSGDASFTARPARSRASRLYFSDAKRSSSNSEFESVELLNHGISVNFMRNSMLSAINEGPVDRGFVYCEKCGYATVTPTKNNPNKHKSPLTSRDCQSPLSSSVRLMHNFVTDVVELDISASQSSTLKQWRSVLYAVMEGAARYLQIERDEIDGTVYWGANGNIRLVIFDNVPGGAGFARQISQQIVDVLRAAFHHVEIECCGADTSCYRCLRNYGNQYYHNDIKRGDALDILRRMMN